MHRKTRLLVGLAALIAAVAATPVAASAADAPATCTVSPFDPVAASFRGAGYGTPQVVVENVTVKAQDYATFQVDCSSVDSDPFSASAVYWFEAAAEFGSWERVSPELTCSASSLPGITRIQTANFAVPGTTGCEFKHFYPEDAPETQVPHRLHIHLTTTVGNDIEGTSLEWGFGGCEPTCP